MMPGSRPPMRGGMPPHPFMTPMQGRPPMGPMMSGPPGMKRGGGRGGLLSKILGKGNAQPAAGMGEQEQQEAPPQVEAYCRQ
ncbi:hypothetical protein M5V91_00310 [Cytobacillus pseudoceanisediminis]|uniref:hypothetical protein n=1 Tax=Cytobacillus pseudoceanisediminis TaxID=3051614 RepID=UPI00218515A5|nr:hypothetical protein [Cytobacillus pseudoceanisediminis]UQX54401.1 hypothetical protein M5V91_00310 [Cytobacillus pseudoceanisediminis]